MTAYTVIAKSNGINYIHIAGCADVRRNANNVDVTNTWNMDCATIEGAMLSSWSDFIDEGSMTEADALAHTVVIACALSAERQAELKKQAQEARAQVAREARTALVKEAKFFVASYGAYQVLEFGDEMLNDHKEYQDKNEAGRAALKAEVMKQANRVLAFLEL